MSYRPDQFIKDNGKMVNGMVKVFNSGLMAPFMRDTGETMLRMDMVD